MLVHKDVVTFNDFHFDWIECDCIGGTGPESTLMYYKELNSKIDQLTGSKAMPDIAIESVNFRKAWNLVVGEDYEALAAYLAEKVTFFNLYG